MASSSSSTSGSDESNCCWNIGRQQGNRPTPTFGYNDKSLESEFFAKLNMHDVPVERINRLPVNERTSALNDVHGASDSKDEPAEKIKQCLDDMDLELCRVQPRGPYEEAMQHDAEYVRSLRLCFLRAVEFNPVKAAYRMATYFSMKCSMFGHHTLGRDLRIYDLSSEARRLLHAGVVQMLPQKDRRGRGVIFLYYERSKNLPPPAVEPLIELYFFWINVAARDHQIQKAGFILLHYGNGYKFQPDSEVHRGLKILSMCTSAMVKCVSIHVSFDRGSPVHILSEMMKSVAEAQFLVRLQSHCGSHFECLYSLNTFGIPSNILPLDFNGQLILNQLHQWISENAPSSASGCGENTEVALSSQQHEARKSPSTTLSSLTTVATPTAFVAPAGPDDIVMGRGRSANTKLKKLTEEYHAHYERADRVEKMAISQIIYQRVTESGARFLLPPSQANNNQWVQLSETEAQTRISHGFRNLRMRQPKLRK